MRVFLTKHQLRWESRRDLRNDTGSRETDMLEVPNDNRSVRAILTKKLIFT